MGDEIYLICSFGGQLTNGNPRYVGGNTKLVTIERTISFSELQARLASLLNNNTNFSIRYEALSTSPLVEVSDDADVRGMMNFLSSSKAIGLYLVTNDIVAVTTREEYTSACASGTFQGGGSKSTLYVAPTCGLEAGQEFVDVKSFRNALVLASIKGHFNVKYLKNDNDRSITAICSADGCPWRLHASKVASAKTFKIRTMYNVHSCELLPDTGHQRAKSHLVANRVTTRLKELQQYKPKEIVVDIKESHGIEVNDMTARRQEILESFEQSFKNLPAYCEEIRRTNSGSIVDLEIESDKSFNRLVVSFYASLVGFVNGCRPLIFLDETHLEGIYKGTSLAACSIDADGEMFPIAVCITFVQNKDAWAWFLQHLREAFEHLDEQRKLTFIMDREKRILDCVLSVFPNAYYGYCVQHLVDNLKLLYKDSELANLLWSAASAYTAYEYTQYMEKIREASPSAADWIKSIPLKAWSNAHFEGARYGNLTSNAAKSFSSWVTEEQDLPIIEVVDKMRIRLTEMLYKRSNNYLDCQTILTPNAEKKLAEAKVVAQDMTLLQSSESRFEVIGSDGTFAVDIDNRTCGCRHWQVDGIPCAHALSAMFRGTQDIYGYCDPYFSIEKYRQTYSESLNPIGDENQWLDGSKYEVRPPRRPAGRPKKQRIHTEEPIKVVRIVHCSHCKQPGHRRTTCKGPI